MSLVQRSWTSAVDQSGTSNRSALLRNARFQGRAPFVLLFPFFLFFLFLETDFATEEDFRHEILFRLLAGPHEKQTASVLSVESPQRAVVIYQTQEWSVGDVWQSWVGVTIPARLDGIYLVSQPCHARTRAFNNCTGFMFHPCRISCSNSSAWHSQSEELLTF